MVMLGSIFDDRFGGNVRPPAEFGGKTTHVAEAVLSLVDQEGGGRGRNPHSIGATLVLRCNGE